MLGNPQTGLLTQTAKFVRPVLVHWHTNWIVDNGRMSTGVGTATTCANTARIKNAQRNRAITFYKGIKNHDNSWMSGAVKGRLCRFNDNDYAQLQHVARNTVQKYLFENLVCHFRKIALSTIVLPKDIWHCLGQTVRVSMCWLTDIC